MFSVNNIDFSNGVYASNGAVNGAEVFLLQSSENADKVISDFEKAIAAGLNPNTVIDTVLKNNNLSEEDFTATDIRRINRKVEALWRASNFGRFN